MFKSKSSAHLFRHDIKISRTKNETSRPLFIPHLFKFDFQMWLH